MIDKYNYNNEPSGRTETLAKALEKCELLENENRKLRALLNELKKMIDMAYAINEARDIAREMEKELEK